MHANTTFGLQVATKEKNAAEERMAKVQARLDEMQAQFDAAMVQKQLLENDAAACQKKMDSAAALLHALAGEQLALPLSVSCLAGQEQGDRHQAGQRGQILECVMLH